MLPSKFDSETKERVVRLFLERREQTPTESFLASFRRVRELTGIPLDTMRGWVTKAQVDAGERPGATTADRDEIRRLKRENAGLRRANEILKTAFSRPRSSTANADSRRLHRCVQASVRGPGRSAGC